MSSYHTIIPYISPYIYPLEHPTRVADPEFYNGGGRSKGGACAPSPEKKFVPEQVGFCASRIIFYVYAKIGQVNGAAAASAP